MKYVREKEKARQLKELEDASSSDSGSTETKNKELEDDQDTKSNRDTFEQGQEDANDVEMNDKGNIVQPELEQIQNQIKDVEQKPLIQTTQLKEMAKNQNENQ